MRVSGWSRLEAATRKVGVIKISDLRGGGFVVAFGRCEGGCVGSAEGGWVFGKGRVGIRRVMGLWSVWGGECDGDGKPLGGRKEDGGF